MRSLRYLAAIGLASTLAAGLALPASAGPRDNFAPNSSAPWGSSWGYGSYGYAPTYGYGYGYGYAPRYGYRYGYAPGFGYAAPSLGYSSGAYGGRAYYADEW